MKVTVIGRPNQVVERQGVIILALRSTKPPTLPKGLPPLPAAPTNYMVFVAQKQWNKVRDAIQNADDALLVEGSGVHELRFAGITSTPRRSRPRRCKPPSAWSRQRQ